MPPRTARADATAPAGPRALAPAPFDVEAVLPELAGLSRETTLLYPRAGRPGPGDSSLGGPLLWPADERWPVCADPDHVAPSAAPVGPEPVAMVPVAQLYTRDVPGLVLPGGADLLQVLWCPLLHERAEDTVNPLLLWRDAESTAARARPGDPPRPHTADEDFLPRPCTVSPTPTVEYPGHDLPEELSQSLGPRFDALEEEHGYDYFGSATTGQSKVGGYPGWTQQPDWPDCDGCGTRMDHLLSITATEPAEGRWLPLDDHAPHLPGRPAGHAEAAPEAVDAFGHAMDLGDLGGVYFFLCRTCPDTPRAHRYDC